MRSIPVLALALAGAAAAAQEIPSPTSFFGHRLGEDRKLAPYERDVDYLRALDRLSPRVSVEEVGRSTLGAEMVVAILTSEANQGRLERYREIARLLHRAAAASPEEAEALAEEGRAILLVTCTIHATEVGCTQMVPDLAFEVATTEDAERRRWLEEVIVLLMPSINPDGQRLVRDWYEQHLGDEYEGGPMPWLYHHYVGHDNNRDFTMLTQAETRVVNDVLYHRWFPQVFVDEHQMGRTGPRMFVPPQTDPVAPEVHSLVFRMADLIGTTMSYRLEEAGKTGVGHDMIYDSYWPGGTRNTAWWKNVVGLLTEVASARIASPVTVDASELEGGEKGLPEYQRRSNFPSPWPGGWWRLADIMDYERIATWAAIEACAGARRELLRNAHRMAREASEAGAAGPPYAWVVRPGQHDAVASGRLVELLLAHGVRVERAEAPFVAGQASYPAGTLVIPAAQPYRPFLLTMLRPQRYPEVTAYAGGPILPPYDVTSWSFPLLLGVELDELEEPLVGSFSAVAEMPWPPVEVEAAPGGWLLPHAADTVYRAMNRLLAAEAEVYWLASEPENGEVGDVYLPPGSVAPAALQELASELHLPVVSLPAPPTGPAYRVRPARVGLYKPWVASMDEGWTRFLLERYEFPFVNLANADLAEGRFSRRQRVDVVLLPDVEADILKEGRPSEEVDRRFWEPLPPEYAGGLDPEGSEKLASWVRAGGTLVALDSASEYAIELLALPVRNVLADVASEQFSAPGTMLRLLVDTEHPLGYGMRREEAGYFAESVAFATAVPHGGLDRRVVARYPEHREDVPVSGYVLGAERLARRAAAVDYEVGDGRAVLIGFRAQHRAQPHRTFKLLFNALYRLEPVELP